MADFPWMTLRALSRTAIRRDAILTVEGQQYLPERGPVMVAARHYHHLLDGAALLATIPRPIHIVVGLDWIESPLVRTTLPRLCRSARWPVIYRSDSENPVGTEQQRRALRQATIDVLAIWRAGGVVVVFPEGYPTIDPAGSRKPDGESLPFADGAVRLTRIANRQGITVPIVPVGFSYEAGEHWQITMRFGEPIAFGDCRASTAHLERVVQDLSARPGDV